MEKITKRGRLLIGTTVAIAALLLVGAVRETRAFGGGHRGGAIMRRIATAHVDEALDAAKVSPEQRQKIHAIKDSLFRTFEDTHRGRGGHIDEALRLFSADRLDRDRVSSLRKERQAEMQRIGDTVEQAIVDAHAILTPEQRRAVAAYVAQHRPGR